MSRTPITPILLLALLVALVAQQHGLILRSDHVNDRPWSRTALAPGAIELGVTTAPLAQNSWRAWQPHELETVDGFEQAARRHANIVMWYVDWRHGQILTSQLLAVAHRGSVPEITWEPWNSTEPLRKPQPRYALRNIIAGKFDRYIRASAERFAAYGRPVLLRFAQEMNGNWYPWGRDNGNRPGQFIQAWRHIHEIFDMEGATNVKWVWSPVSGAPASDFPGPSEVNVLGVTCLNGGTGPSFSRHWRSFKSICGKSIAELHALDPQLPIQLSETGSATIGGNKATWIANMFRFLAHQSEVTSLVWFNLRKTSIDWMIQSTPSASRAFAVGDRLSRGRATSK